MADDSGREPGLGEPSSEVAGNRRRPWLALIVGVAAFVVGVGVGALAVTVMDDEDEPTAADTEPVDGVDPDGAPGDAQDEDEERTIPAACLEAFELSEQGLVVLDQAITSVRNLQAAELDAALTRFEELQPQLADAVDRCRQRAPR